MKVFGQGIPARVPAAVPGAGGATGALFPCAPRGNRIKGHKAADLGKHQAINAACAMAASQWYTDPRERTDPEVYRGALEKSKVPGRLEILAPHPLVVTDGAHNVSALTGWPSR